MTSLVLVGLNELNFDFVRRYVEQGRLPVLGALLEAHGDIRTTSESTYPEWEPWIQWVTVQTGKTLGEHNVFRLGDIVQTDHEQIWEQLEKRGVSVGALSPMNAANRARKPAFFLPDPWTDTPITAPAIETLVYKGARKAVLGNAHGGPGLDVLARLVAGLPFLAKPNSYPAYLSLGSRSLSRPWARAAILDLLLGDMFRGLLKRRKPDFASVFMNAAAHVQHHYMFNSAAYQGEQRNPDWYISADDDPILPIYEVYDRLIGDLRREHPDARLLIATGLHQVPHGATTHYWRLKEHAAFLAKTGVEFERVEARMSRDFVIECASIEDGARAEARLALICTSAGDPLFRVDNRGETLFVELVHDDGIPDTATYVVANGAPRPLRPEVAFVAIKNGEHNGEGYLIDTWATAEASPSTVPLTRIHGMILEHFDSRAAIAA